MRRFLVRLGLALVPTLFVLLVLEGAVRWVDPVINRDPWWKYDPLLGWRADPANGHFDGVLASGFRHRDFPKSKPAGVKRLVVLGDSFSLGVAVKASETLAGRLEIQLDRPGLDWQVLNLAVNDWGTAQQLIALKEIGLAYQPDAVILQTFPLNDLCNNCPVMAFTCSFQDAHRPYLLPRSETRTSSRPEQGSGSPSHTQGTAGRAVGKTPTRPDDFEQVYIDWWAPLRVSRLFLWVESVIDQRGVDEAESDEHQERGRRLQRNAEAAGLEWEGGVSSLLPEQEQQPQVRQCWRVTEALILALRDLLKQRGIPLIGLVVPFSATFEERWPEMLERFPAPMERTYASDRMEEIFRSNGIPVLSVRAEILQSQDPPDSFFVSRDDGHFGPRGHARAAGWIEAALRRQGLLP